MEVSGEMRQRALDVTERSRTWMEDEGLNFCQCDRVCSAPHPKIISGKKNERENSLMNDRQTVESRVKHLMFFYTWNLHPGGKL